MKRAKQRGWRVPMRPQPVWFNGQLVYEHDPLFKYLLRKIVAARLRRLRGRLPAGYKFDRQDANSRK